MQALAAANRPAPAPRESYQAKFSRNVTELCGDAAHNPGDFNVTGTRCTQRPVGPVVFIAKTSTPLVFQDSYDGDKNGQDDVQQAYDSFVRGNGNNAEASIAGFLQQVRNRASVNGGSIDLVALIVTGRTNTGAFATFGPADRILFSPCFPVIQALDYNIDIYGFVQGLPTKFYLRVWFFNVFMAIVVEFWLKLILFRLNTDFLLLKMANAHQPTLMTTRLSTPLPRLT